MSDAVEGNGHMPFGDEVTEALQRRIGRQQARVAMLEGELQQVKPQLRRDERALALLLGETEPLGRPSKPAGKKDGRTSTRVGADKVEAVKQDILRYCEDHEEFRQIDIRNMPGAAIVNSGSIATVFETLRQENFLRFVRKDGLSKIFRLTHATVASA